MHVHIVRYCCAQKGNRFAGFWEVRAVQGLEQIEYTPQRSIYHITDTASLVGVAAKEVAEICLRISESSSLDWSILELPRSLACIQAGGYQTSAVIQMY